MKKATFLFAIVLLVIASCKKTKQPGDDYGCITRVVNTPIDYTITAAQYADAVRLFAQAKYDITNLRLTHVLYDTTATGVDTIYTGEQFYAHGLMPIFNYNPTYTFNNGTTSYVDDLNPALAIDTGSHLRLSQVRKIYMDNAGSAFKDSCLRAEFGLFGQHNLNTPTSQITSFFKIWRVRPPHADYPMGYIKDDGTVIGFSTGVSTL